MKYLALSLVGILAGACASDPPPPAASSDTVMVATDNPSNDTTAAPTDVSRAADADRRAEALDDNGSSSTASADARTRLPGNAPATPAPDTSGVAPDTMGQPAPAAQPDNSRVNERDKSDKALTPVDQGGSESDRKLTQQIRQAVMKDGSLSFTAKNCKIITVNGKVTLRGPVNSEQERSAIEAAARKVAGANQIENLLEIKK